MSDSYSVDTAGGINEATPPSGAGPLYPQNPLPESSSEMDIPRTHVVDVSPTVRVKDETGQDVSDREEGDTPQWYYAEGVPGKGEPPPWYNKKTYGTIEDQAKAHPELRKKLGSFEGAPDEGYDIDLGEDHTDFAFDESDAFLNDFAEMAKEMNMSQEGFNHILSKYVSEVKTIEAAEEEESHAYWKDELAKLGPNGVEELKVLKQWSRNALPEELQGTFDSMVTSADAVKLFNKLIDQTIPTQLTHVAPGTGINRHQLREMMAHPDYGRVDDYTKHVDSEANAMYGRTKIYD